MPVPDTTTFTLADVCNEIGLVGTDRNLSQCFTSANAAGFDTTYSGSKNNLLNFRNYNHTPAAPTMTLNPQTLTSVGASAGSFNMSVSSNTTWNISDNAAWVTITGASGSGNDSTITISYTENTTGSPRSATITATTNAGSPTASDSTSFDQLSGFE